MVSGAIIAGATDLSYSLPGYIWVAICAVSTAAYLLLIRKLSDKTGGSCALERLVNARTMTANQSRPFSALWSGTSHRGSAFLMFVFKDLASDGTTVPQSRYLSSKMWP